MSLLQKLQKDIRERAFVTSENTRKIIREEKSGPREMPWLFDFRAIMLEPRSLNAYAELFWERYAHKLPFQVGGLETAAIALVAAIVMKGVERGTPVNGFFIRKSRKREGLLKQVEGTLTDDPIILVDDLMNSGSTFNKQIGILRSLDKRVSDIFAILTFRPHDAYTFATEANIAISELFTLKDMGMPLLTQSTPHIPQAHFDVLWKYSAPSPGLEYVVQKSGPCIDDERIYFGTDAGVFVSLNQSDGHIVWTYEIEKHPKGKGIFSSPALHGNTVYFGAYDGTVYALDAKRGTLLWKYGDADWIGSSPALAARVGVVYIGLEFGLFRKRGGIAALDLATGRVRWRDRTPSLTHGSPLYIEDESLVVIGSNDGVVYAYDAKSGERRWTYQSGSDIKTRPAYDAVRRLVLVPSMDSKLYALSARDGAPRWAFQTGASIYSNPLVHADAVFVASLDKTLYRVDLRNGHVQWEFATNGRIFASPILADDSLWIGSNDGKLYELDVESGVVKATHQFTERIVNAIAYNATTARLFVPTVANEVYCLKRDES